MSSHSHSGDERLKKRASWMDHRFLEEARPGQLVIRTHPATIIFVKAVLLVCSIWIVLGLARFALTGGPSPFILIIPSVLGLMTWRGFRELGLTITLDKGNDRIEITGRQPIRLSDVQRIYVARWRGHSLHSTTLSELNLETSDGRRENLLVTPFRDSFEEQVKQVADWLGLPFPG